MLLSVFKSKEQREIEREIAKTRKYLKKLHKAILRGLREALTYSGGGPESLPRRSAFHVRPDTIDLVGVKLAYLMSDKVGALLRQCWHGSDEQLRRAEVELLVLRVMAIDYATYSQFGPTSPVRDALLEGFLEAPMQLLREAGLDLEQRQDGYQRAIRECVVNDPSRAVGSHFAECCGCPPVTFTLLSTLAEAEFRDLSVRTLVFLKAFRFQCARFAHNETE